MVAKIVVFAALLGVVVGHSAFSSQHIKKYDGSLDSGHSQGYGHGHGQWSDGLTSGHGQRQGFGYSQGQGFGFGQGQGFGHGQVEGFGRGQRQGYGHGHAHGYRQGHGHQHNDHHAHPKYEFEYTVEDSHTGDHKSQQESRDGDVVHGSYSLLQPDGTIRDVQYHGDHHSGFHADVHYSTNHGQPQHDNNKHFY